ncbi:O-antigen ligase family protein [Thiohalobacter thiocyanaticus]|uniref:O-antigen ligase family protein n=1 Tax=Thiohalobacter thiocyanaticus TaxID=585455 RepID=UPI00131A1950|nr:O-antigen ligase family protein [Thiohalobacter thiocyanaticus]
MILLVFLALVVLWTQTRAVWLACALVLPVVLLALVVHSLQHPRSGKVLMIILAGTAVLAAAVLLNGGIIEKRLMTDVERVVSLLTTENVEGLDATGLRSRMPLWAEAWERIEARPLTGWGAGTSEMLIVSSGVKPPQSHFHNLYLQLLAEIGVVGLCLFLLWVGLALKTASTACGPRTRDFSLLLFLLAAIALFLLAGMFQIRHDDERGHFFLILFGALAVSRAMVAGSDPDRDGEQTQ